jgi:hypothetical protein
MSRFEPYKTIAALEVRPTSADGWNCLIDGHFLYAGLQKENEQNMLPGFTPRWRVTIYQSEAQGVQKFFKSEQDARATYGALVTSKIPSPRTLVDIWGFEWNF